MPHIVLTEEQARVVSQSQNGIEVRDPEGRPIAFFNAMSPDDAAAVAESRRRLQRTGRRIPSARVMDMLSQLQQLNDRGEATPERIRAIVQEVVAGDRQ